jgi:AraC-like DNA-binding protein
MRTDKIAQLLVETQMPVCEIAETLGFGDVQHFARYFRAVKKVSPLAYRKQFGGHATQPLSSQFGDSYTQSGVVGRGMRPVKSGV